MACLSTLTPPLRLYAIDARAFESRLSRRRRARGIYPASTPSTRVPCVMPNYDLRASPLPFFSRRRFRTSSSKEDSPSKGSSSEGRGASRQYGRCSASDADSRDDGSHCRMASTKSSASASNAEKRSRKVRSFPAGSSLSSGSQNLCGNQISGAPRHRRDAVSVAASARWRGAPQRSPPN